MSTFVLAEAHMVMLAALMASLVLTAFAVFIRHAAGEPRFPRWDPCGSKFCFFSGTQDSQMMHHG